MKKEKLPFLPIGLTTAKRLGRPFMGYAESILPLFPYLKLQLTQAELKIEPKDFIAIGLFFGTLFAIISALISSLFYYGMNQTISFPIAFSVGLLFGLISFIYFLLSPRISITKKIRAIEQNLLFSMRSLLIQVSSGVPLYTSLTAIAKSDYGKVSEEFKKAVEEISTGTPQEKALGKLTLSNPSTFFRRTIWQLTNGMKSGADLTYVLKSAIENLSNEQRIQIKEYGSQLNPLALIYMVVSVIVPALGMTFFLVLSSFPSIPVSEVMLWSFLFILALAQMMLLGLIKSRRPNLLG